MPVVNSESFEIENDQTRRSKGPLIKVSLGNGQFVKMYEADVYPERKMRNLPENKMLKSDPLSKDTIEPGSDDPVVFDDLTVVPGIGPASQKALNSNGIYTWAQLAAAEELPFLSDAINEKIAQWREGFVPDSE